MPEFTGEAGRVRCVDCTSLSGKHCARKNTSVAPKKRRTCSVYTFKGEYVNRTPPETMYLPYVDKGTRRLIRRMQRLGIIPVAESPDQEGGYKAVPMPRSTATAGVLNVKPEAAPEEAGPEEQGSTTTLNPATTGPDIPGVRKSEDKDESGSSRS